MVLFFVSSFAGYSSDRDQLEFLNVSVVLSICFPGFLSLFPDAYQKATLQSTAWGVYCAKLHAKGKEKEE